MSTLNSLRALGRTAIGRPADWNLRRPNIRSPRVSARLVGPLLIVGSVVASWAAFDGATGEEGTVSFGLWIGAASILLMAWSFVLAIRIRFLEPLFGGLDAIYRAHRWTGTLAVIAMFLHVRAEPEIEGGIRGASKSVAESAEGLAGTGEWMLYVLVGISMIRWFPYRWWRLTHKLLGVPFAFACFHFYTAEKTYANGSAWGWWFGSFMVAGLVAYVIRVAGKDALRRGVRYRVGEAVRRGTTTELILEPVGSKLVHRAGQFAAIKIQARGLSEPHMFTIASGPDEPNLRFFVRDLGDWTAKIQSAEIVGTDVFVEAPFGEFEPIEPHAKRTLWVAGGVGITPFLSATEALAHSPLAQAPVLAYCVRTRGDATAIEVLERAHADGRIILEVFESSAGNRFDRDALTRLAGESGLADTHVAVCGPLGLVRDIDARARRLGARAVETEAFDIRGGFGPDLSVPIAALTDSR